MYLSYLLVAVFSFHGGLSTTCPRRCSCDPAQSVQCYRAMEIPREIPSTTRRLYISHSKIKQLQVGKNPVKILPVVHCNQKLCFPDGGGFQVKGESYSTF